MFRLSFRFINSLINVNCRLVNLIAYGILTAKFNQFVVRADAAQTTKLAALTAKKQPDLHKCR